MECAPRCSAHHQRNNYLKFRNSGKSADFPELPFHGRGRNGKRHLQRRFLRKRGAAGERPRPLRQVASLTATSPQGRGLGMAVQFPAQTQSLRACSLPLGGAVAQRLRGFESAEPEKTVKRSSRRTGVNLQFFSGVAHSFGVKRGEQPLFRGSSASKSLALFWFSFGVKREHPPAASSYPATHTFLPHKKPRRPLRSPGLFGDFGTVCSQSLVIKEEYAGFYHRIGLSRSPVSAMPCFSA